MTIPEQDARAPEEDWTAGLPIVRRGIQFQDWNEIADGIILSLEQTENYERQRGPEGDRDDWHDRTRGIEEPTKKAVGKWMPEELMKLAERKRRNELCCDENVSLCLAIFEYYCCSEVFQFTRARDWKNQDPCQAGTEL